VAYVITEPCISVKDRGCTTVCPCDCIHEGTMEKDGRKYDMLFIDPEPCIDCGLCEVECPVGAIFADVNVPTKWQEYISLNAEFFDHRARRR
jgi:NAD-dependent dihydropyrimidine dehydrogenase PreA subunit